MIIFGYDLFVVIVKQIDFATQLIFILKNLCFLF